MGDFSKLSDQPTDPDETRNGTDLTPLQKFISRCKGMLIGTEYDYARSTIEGILQTVETRRYVTEGQERAIDILPRVRRGRGAWGDGRRGGTVAKPLSISLLAVCVLLSGILVHGYYTHTTQWTIPIPLTALGPANDNLHIIDTTGACIYYVHEGGIAVLSKASLPAGAGCQ